MIFWNRLMSWIPAIILLGILIFIYSIYFVFNIQPNFEGFNLEIVIQHLMIFMFLISLLRAMILEPGAICQELIDETWKQWDEYQQQEKERLTEQRQRRSQRSVKTFKTENDEDRSVVNMDADENLDDDYNIKKDINQKGIEKRFCKKCCIPKPLRTHHCSQCRCCWQRMDHHCQWINNCVAKDNYKIFICMIFYASCLLVWVSISQYRIYINVIETDMPDLILFIIVLHYYFILLITVLINGFFIFHLYLISQNKTTLEQLEDKPDVLLNHYTRDKIIIKEYGKISNQLWVQIFYYGFYQLNDIIITYQQKLYKVQNHISLSCYFINFVRFYFIPNLPDVVEDLSIDFFDNDFNKIEAKQVLYPFPGKFEELGTEQIDYYYLFYSRINKMTYIKLPFTFLLFISFQLSFSLRQRQKKNTKEQAAAKQKIDLVKPIIQKKKQSIQRKAPQQFVNNRGNPKYECK